ncbi:polysaccharide biosynthesis tyrosine autokinase [uncultured Microbacterium sp.]|uniref:polysaccharide biosynthesis tyrosine autokinase n=1 Tax=uncultured Microbacterium sp. TaxID=191216 RepID=UPI00260A7F72|nr:polysaccharide biosynthesis tyrosine autokinase [uncultured Microbacterium sp.]
MTVLDFLVLLRRGWWILVIGVLLGALGGFVGAQLTPPVYTAQATGFIAGTGGSVIAGTSTATDRAGAYMPLINTAQVHQQIAQDANVPQSQLNGSLSAEVVTGSTMVRVTATASDPQSALNLANGALRALANVVARIEAAAGGTATPAPDGSVVQGDGIVIVPLDEAVPPTSPSAPDKRAMIIAGALIGLAAALLILLLRRALDVRVRAHTDVAALVGAGVLGRVPKLDVNGRRAKDAIARAVAHEAYRRIRTGLRFASVDQEVRVVLVTSANLGEGKSSTTRALARVLAESGQRTLVIDGDLRRPTVAEGFDLDGTVGLSEVLSGQLPIGSAIRRTQDPNLFVLPAGGIPPNPSEMLGSTAFQRLLSELRQTFFIIVDVPPVLPVTDASVMSALVDGVVFVVAMGSTRKVDIVEACDQLRLVRARILGVVITFVAMRNSANGYGSYRKNQSYYTQTSVHDSSADDEDAEGSLLDLEATLAQAARPENSGAVGAGRRNARTGARRSGVARTSVPDTVGEGRDAPA